MTYIHILKGDTSKRFSIRIRLGIINFKCFFIKSRNGWTLDAFSSFDALFFPKKKSVQAAKNVCAVYRDGADSIVLRWFARFRSGHFDLKDWHPYGRSIKITPIKNSPDNPTRDIGALRFNEKMNRQNFDRRLCAQNFKKSTHL